MNRPFTSSKSALAGVCAALVLLLMAAVGAGAAEVVVHYTKESPAAFEQQLSRGEVAAATENKKVRSIRLTLKDGRHVLVKYAKRQSAAEAAKLRAHHVTVTVLTPVQANKELKAAPKHHKIRYIVAGALIVVILLIGVVFLIRRRRERD